MKKVFQLAVLFIAVSALFASCEKSPVEGTQLQQRKVREAWIRLNYDGKVLSETKSGLMILEEEKGSGEAVKGSSFCFVNYSVKQLDGTYIFSTDPNIAKINLGTYSDTSYYSPDIWRADDFIQIDGERELLMRMKEGGKMKAIIPPELSDITYPKEYSSYYQYSNPRYTENMIYDISVEKVINDMPAYETSLLENYANKYWGGVDSISANFYMVKLIERATDTIKEGASINIFYSGHLIDGITDNYLFDTNQADTARIYRHFNRNKSYTALTATFKKDISEFKNNNSFVEGFSEAICRMNYGEEAIVFFSSDLGYNAEGSGEIPPYCPLAFYIRIGEEVKL